MGTPQMRWREMHQSGRVATMFVMRSSPRGSHLRLDLVEGPVGGWFGGVGRAHGGSISMNHCSVARVMTGLWQRQQCG